MQKPYERQIQEIVRREYGITDHSLNIEGQEIHPRRLRVSLDDLWRGEGAHDLVVLSAISPLHFQGIRTSGYFEGDFFAFSRYENGLLLRPYRGHTATGGISILKPRIRAYETSAGKEDLIVGDERTLHLIFGKIFPLYQYTLEVLISDSFPPVSPPMGFKQE